MTIELDSTRYSTVVTCTHCPWWYGFADSKAEGYAVGARHEERAHPGEDTARYVIRKRRSRARHADAATKSRGDVTNRLDAPARGNR